MEIVVVDYGAGNVQSVLYALNRLGASGTLSHEPDVIRRATHVLFPGVGHAAPALRRLQETGLNTVLLTLTQPVLGICLGMQLLCQHTTEGDTPGLGVFPARCVHFREEMSDHLPEPLPIPHVGWNTLELGNSPLWQGLPEDSSVYFVHSYCVPLSAATTATCHYGIPFTAALQHRNFHGVQFHPEKSAQTGERILANFLALE
jgi:glutamine amidotransferase